MTVDMACRLRADHSATSVVVLCSCGARVADTRASVAWALAAGHALVHGPKSRAAVQAAHKYAREARRKEPR